MKTGPGFQSKYCCERCRRSADNERKRLGKDSGKRFIKQCENCFICFETRRSSAMFCNPLCFLKRNKLKWRKCIVCRESFQPQSTNYNCCSLACSNTQGWITKRLNNPDMKKRRINKKRVRLRKHILEKFDREEIFERDNWTCQICGKRIYRYRNIKHYHNRKPSMDHIIPLSKGGMHERKNVQTACLECNSLKTDGTTENGEQLLMYG